MAVSRKVERELLREEYLNSIIELFNGTYMRVADGYVWDTDVVRVKSNEIAIPVVGCEGNEDWIVVTVKVPTGANKGTEPYDGYEMAQDYEMKVEEKARKKAEAEKKKADKIAKDEAIRQKKKEIAEKGE